MKDEPQDLNGRLLRIRCVILIRTCNLNIEVLPRTDGSLLVNGEATGEAW